jgi:flagellar basal-body rod protein FlgB
MSKVFFEDGPMNLMERFMDLAVQRQSLISGNLANVDTPGYKTVDIDFEQELQSAIGQEVLSTEVTNVRHFSKKVDIEGGATGSPREVDGLTLRNDMNNVNIDREMAEMSTNGLKFSTVAQLIAEKFRILKSAVLEGR